MQMPRRARGKDFLRRFRGSLRSVGVGFPDHNVEFGRGETQGFNLAGRMCSKPAVQFPRGLAAAGKAAGELAAGDEG